ncbi:MAG: hypothetical protein M1546_23885, partial [Chloroflexi bacterium]|nr:hypothetical protein [Chloroflexota bacterium]
MHIGNLFRLSYWLDPSALDHRAGTVMWLVIAAGLLWSSITLILAIRKRARHSAGIPFDIALAQVAAGLIAAAVALGRLYALAPLGLRAGWLIAGAIAAAPLAPRILRQVLRDGVLSDALAVMAFVRPAPSLQPWHPATIMAWLGLHLLGLAAVLSIARWPIWLAPVLLLLVLAPPRS